MENLISKPHQKIACLNLIHGAWTKGLGEDFPILSPYYGEEIGEGTFSTEKDVEQAVQSASEAQKTWAATPLKERSQCLFQFRQLILENLNDLAQTVSLENGKTLSESKAGILKGVEVLEYALSLQNGDQGGKMEVSRSVFCEYRRRPLGVVANITPFNFPAMVPMWTIPIVLALGNAYIWKPSEKTPLTSLKLGQLILDSEFPKGLFNIVQGGVSTVEAIIDHPQVKAIGFVGSTAVAKKVFQRGSQLGKRVLALGGAKNHIVLLPDADSELTGKGISDSFTGCAGQRCMAASVLLAVGDVDHHIEKICERASSLRLGDSMGAIISKDQLEFLQKAISRAEADGAKILLDGRNIEPIDNYKGGYWLGPTILDQVKPGSEAAQMELFGPILSIVRCDSISQALEIQNQSEYGNACSVFTSSGSLSEKVLKQAHAGMLGVNIGVPVPREPFSFGGIGASKFGHGDITGPASLNFWSDLQKVTTKWEVQSDENWMS